MTNYEKIKNMSVKEMSRFIYDIATFCNRNGYYKTQDFCKYCPIDCGDGSVFDIAIWIESEVKEK